MLLIICVDRDDDIGRKTGIETPVIGRDRVEEVALKFGASDPEDSDLNALFEGLRIYDNYDNTDDEVEIVVLTGISESHVDSDREIAKKLDEVLEEIPADSAIVVTDGAEDESVIPIVESRLKIDSVRRTVVRQSEHLENTYYVVKQLLRDPETRGTVLVPIGLILMIYPLDLISRELGFPGAALGLTSGLLGIYLLVKGLGLDETFERLSDRVERASERAREGIYSGKVSLITYLIAGALLLIGIASGLEEVRNYNAAGGEVIPGVVPLVMSFIQGAVIWLTFGGIISSIGKILEDYIKNDSFPWSLLNAPFYIISIGLVLHGVSQFLLYDRTSAAYLAIIIVISIGIGATSTALFGAISSGSGRKAKEELTEVD